MQKLSGRVGICVGTPGVDGVGFEDVVGLGRVKMIRIGEWFRLDIDGYDWHEGRTDDMLKVCGIWGASTSGRVCGSTA